VRVLAVGNMYPPHHLGGYELVWRSAMRELRARGHVTRVLTTDLRMESVSEPDEPETFRELRWYWRDHAWPRFGWRATIALERHNAVVLDRHLEEFDPDVISWWAMGGMSLALIERVRRRGLPAVGFVADDWLIYGPKVDAWTRRFRGWRSPAASLAVRLTGLPAAVDLDVAARYVLISETVRNRARAEGGWRLEGSTIAHLGVDPDFLDPRPERDWGWRLLYVGRIDPRKGIEDAVRALAVLPDEATLAIAGDGDPDERERLRVLIASLGLGDRVEMIGMRSHAELPDVYAAADAVLFPVRWPEPWGIVPLEAMALGRPVAATGTGGSGEYLSDGVNCVLATPEDPVSLARSVRRLAEDPQLRARLREGGVRTAATHTEPVFNAAVVRALEAATRL
jgi:glycogen synthase